MTKKPPADDVTDDDLSLSGPQRSAAGVPAIVASVRHAVGEMGARRSVQALRRVNQKDGFDCPGCAWPEGDHRHIVEFCENGAKAVAEEATVRRITREFFARHAVSALAERTDYWLGQQGRLTEPMHKASAATTTRRFRGMTRSR